MTYPCYFLLSTESGNVNLRGGPVSIVLQNLVEILSSCDTTEVDVLPQVGIGRWPQCIYTFIELRAM